MAKTRLIEALLSPFYRLGRGGERLGLRGDLTVSDYAARRGVQWDVARDDLRQLTRQGLVMCEIAGTGDGVGVYRLTDAALPPPRLSDQEVHGRAARIAFRSWQPWPPEVEVTLAQLLARDAIDMRARHKHQWGRM